VSVGIPTGSLVQACTWSSVLALVWILVSLLIVSMFYNIFLICRPKKAQDKPGKAQDQPGKRSTLQMPLPLGSPLLFRRFLGGLEPVPHPVIDLPNRFR
jgi:hypothetical protein